MRTLKDEDLGALITQEQEEFLIDMTIDFWQNLQNKAEQEGARFEMVTLVLPRQMIESMVIDGIHRSTSNEKVPSKSNEEGISYARRDVVNAGMLMLALRNHDATKGEPGEDGGDDDD